MKYPNSPETLVGLMEQSGGEMMAGWLTRANVELRGAGVDESPDCYKRLPEVLREQGDTIRILHTLTPVGVAMAGKDIYDPYSD